MYKCSSVKHFFYFSCVVSNSLRRNNSAFFTFSIFFYSEQKEMNIFSINSIFISFTLEKAQNKRQTKSKSKELCEKLARKKKKKIKENIKITKKAFNIIIKIITSFFSIYCFMHARCTTVSFVFSFGRNVRKNNNVKEENERFL